MLSVDMGQKPVRSFNKLSITFLDCFDVTSCNLLALGESLPTCLLFYHVTSNQKKNSIPECQLWWIESQFARCTISTNSCPHLEQGWKCNPVIWENVGFPSERCLRGGISNKSQNLICVRKWRAILNCTVEGHKRMREKKVFCYIWRFWK